MARDHFLTDRVRALRRDATDAEKLLWHHLRRRTLAGAKFRRQVQIDCYIADFLCAERRLIIELDGGQHAGSATDVTRTVYLKRQGFRVVRFWNTDVLTNIEGVLIVIEAALAEGRPGPLRPPHPAS